MYQQTDEGYIAKGSECWLDSAERTLNYVAHDVDDYKLAKAQALLGIGQEIRELRRQLAEQLVH